MLQNSFIHIPGISRGAEISLWNNGIHSWQDFFNSQKSICMTSQKKSVIATNLQNSIKALEKKDFLHFLTMPQNQHWRLYSEMRQKTCFLDIETTGLSKDHNDITLIGIHGEDGTKIFMKGKDLERFEEELKKYSKVITFNGKCFDIPFLKKKFPGLCLPPYHSDLRYIMADLGFRGGLKSIEKARGIARDDELEGMDGFEAVILWHRYQRGDNDSLAKLKKYLKADVENLRILMDQASAEMKKRHFYDIIGKH